MMISKLARQAFIPPPLYDITHFTVTVASQQNYSLQSSTDIGGWGVTEASTRLQCVYSDFDGFISLSQWQGDKQTVTWMGCVDGWQTPCPGLSRLSIALCCISELISSHSHSLVSWVTGHFKVTLLSSSSSNSRKRNAHKKE